MDTSFNLTERQREINPSRDQDAVKMPMRDDQDIAGVRTFFFVLPMVLADLAEFSFKHAKRMTTNLGNNRINSSVHIFDTLSTRTSVKIDRCIICVITLLLMIIPIFPDRPSWVLSFDL